VRSDGTGALVPPASVEMERSSFPLDSWHQRQQAGPGAAALVSTSLASEFNAEDERAAWFQNEITVWEKTRPSVKVTDGARLKLIPRLCC